MKLLKTPMKIRNVEIPNRIVLPPMATATARDGKVTERMLEHYSSRGGVGMAITEYSYVSREGMSDERQLSFSREEDIEGLKRLAGVIHRNGSKAVAQINHGGGTSEPYMTGQPALLVSKDSYFQWPEPAQEMQQADIDRIVDAYAAAARRAKAAGFDGVELHSAHGFLLNQFYSPLTNRRTDANGGNLKNRIRIHLEMIKAIREITDDNFLLTVRLGACDYMEGGSTIADGVEAAVEFEKAGADFLDISGGFCGFIRKGHTEPGYFSELTETIKQSVSVPVILTGGVKDGKSAEKLLRSKKADLIGIGRSLLRDSDWARKVMESEWEDVDG